MKMPKVTIIIPVYKGENYMREAIDSALKQTYKNLEILVINDGSPDNGMTEKIAKSYGDKIKYMSKENGGVSTVLNMAIKEMSGEYFSWLSHDDVYYPEKIEEEVNYLLEHKLLGKKVILYSDYDLIDENSNKFAEVIRDHEMLEKKPEYSLLRCIVNGITLLIPKKAFDECGNFDENLRCVQDYELWYKMMKKGYEFTHIPKILATTRCHSAQVTNTSPKVITEGNEFWIRMIDDISLETKIKLEKSEYNYYYEMSKFLEQTPYELAKQHCVKMLNKILIKNKEKVEKLLVSVVIPFSYDDNSLINSVKSVLKQTHKNVEIILVNYGEDKKCNHIKKHILNLKNVKLISDNNVDNFFAALYYGIKNIKGEYVCFLNSGDLFIKDKIYTQLALHYVTKCVVSHSNYIIKNKEQEVMIDINKHLEDMSFNIINNNLINVSAVMLHKKYFVDNNYTLNNQKEFDSFFLEMLSKDELLIVDKNLSICAKENCNNERNINEIKSILTFVLNNKKLSKYDKEIGVLAKTYIELLGIDFVDKKRLIKTKNIRVNKIFEYIKKHGIKQTVKKIFKLITKEN